MTSHGTSQESALLFIWCQSFLLSLLSQLGCCWPATVRHCKIPWWILEWHVQGVGGGHGVWGNCTVLYWLKISPYQSWSSSTKIPILHSCSLPLERTTVHGTLQPSQSSLIVHSPPALVGTGILWSSTSTFSARLLAPCIALFSAHTFIWHIQGICGCHVSDLLFFPITPW